MSLVTVPLENAVNGTAWLQTLRSKSVMGLSSVVLIFEPGTDLMRARQLVQERIAQVAQQLPSVGRAPVLLSPLSSTSRVLKGFKFISLKGFRNGMGAFDCRRIWD